MAARIEAPTLQGRGDLGLAVRMATPCEGLRDVEVRPEAHGRRIQHLEASSGPCAALLPPRVCDGSWPFAPSLPPDAAEVPRYGARQTSRGASAGRRHVERLLLAEDFGDVAIEGIPGLSGPIIFANSL